MTTRDTYTTQTWENLPSDETPISAERLAHIEQGIKDAADKRALKEIYDDAGAKIGLSNTIMSVNGYIVNGNGNILQNGSNICINGNSNNISGSENSISGSGNTVSGTANSVNGISNTVTGSGGTTIEGYRNKADNANYSHISGADNKMEEGNRYAVFMHGAINECRGSSAGVVFGAGNILKGDTQFVTGKYSKEDEYKAFIVGGGTSDTDRKNIHTLDWSGNAYYAGDVTNGAGVSLNGLKEILDNLQAEYMTYDETITALNSQETGEINKIPNIYAIRDWCKALINLSEEV